MNNLFNVIVLTPGEFIGILGSVLVLVASIAYAYFTLTKEEQIEDEA